jgi:hypothetical protein
MGYRSDIGICFTARGYKEFSGKLADLKEEYPDPELYDKVLGLLTYADKRLEDVNGSVLYVFENMKWYTFAHNSDYSDVLWLQDTVTSIDDADYLFIRMGEDYDDVEMHGDYWYNPFELGIRHELEYHSTGGVVHD